MVVTAHSLTYNWYASNNKLANITIYYYFGISQ